MKIITNTRPDLHENAVNEELALGNKILSQMAVPYKGSEVLFVSYIDEKGNALSYDANTGTGSIDEQNGVEIVIKNSTGFTPPTGDSFSKWNTKADGSGTDYNPGDTIELSDNVTLYAIWE